MVTNETAPLGFIPGGDKDEKIKLERMEAKGIYCDECPNMQEHHIANILDSLGQFYTHKVNVIVDNMYFYTWDFFLGEDLGMVIQADGVNGHGTKYSLTDDVIQCRIPYIKNILHLEAETEDELREIIVRALASTDDS